MLKKRRRDGILMGDKKPADKKQTSKDKSTGAKKGAKTPEKGGKKPAPSKKK